MKIDTLVLQTVGRLAGLRAFVELLDDALPRSEWQQNEALRKTAEEEGWDYGDFDVERQGLYERFGFWLPRFASYSVVTLLYTILETQLAAAAKRIHVAQNVVFQPTDVRGQGIEAAALYLARTGVYEVRQDLAWGTMCDLRDLRHLIVHRAGTKGESDEHKRTAQRLGRAYVGRLEFPASDWTWYGEVWISLPLCREFIAAVEGLFDRVFDAMGLPPRYQRRRVEDAG